MRSMVTTLPNFDTPTQYGSYWLGKSILYIENQGVQVTSLEGDSDTFENLSNVINNLNPACFYGFGHGNEDTLFGQYFEILLKKGINEELMTGRVVHILACLTGVRDGLCEALAAKGAIAAIGYSVNFVIGIDTTDMPIVPNNIATESLINPDLEIEYSLSRGLSVADAIINSDDLSQDEIEKWRASGHPDADLVIWSHINNMDGKIVYGVPSVQTRAQVPASPRVTVGIFTALGIIGSLLVVTGRKKK